MLLNAGCFLRVTLQAATDLRPAFFAVVGVSGVLELAALAWWGAHLIHLMVARGAREVVTKGTPSYPCFDGRP